MTHALRDLGRVMRSERLKLKGTLALWLAVIAPAVVVVLEVLSVYARRDFYLARPPQDAWSEYMTMTMILWCMMMLPLFVALETALVGQLEHSNHQWKHLNALPVSRGALYAAKQLSGMVLIGLSLFALVVLLLLGGLLLRWGVPGMGLEAPVPVGEVTQFAGLAFLGAWLVISIQTWVAQRWPSFVVASGVGIAMTIIGVVVIQSKVAGYYPWTLPILVANGFSTRIHPLNILAEGVRPIKELLAGSVGGLVVALLGGWDVVRRDVF